MPKTMPSNLTELKNQISQPGAWVWLMTITLPGNAITLRYASNTEDLVYGGNTYTAFNFTIDSFTSNCDGEIPEFTMTVSNIGYAIQDYMRTYDGLIGSIVTYVQINTDFLAEDYSEDLMQFTVIGAQNSWPNIQFTLSIPPNLRYRVPEDRYNPYSCRHAFRTPAGEYTTRCGYTGKTIVTATLPSGLPVSVQVTGHGFVTGDNVRIFNIVGITGGLDGDYTVTRVNDNVFTLDGTDGDDYAGAFTSGDAGYAGCNRIPKDCMTRGQFPDNYGGPISLRREAVRYA